MAWMLGLADAVHPGTGLSSCSTPSCSSAACCRSCGLRHACPGLRRSRRDHRRPPTIRPLPGIVWKDILFADAAIAGFVLLAHAASRWPPRGKDGADRCRVFSFRPGNACAPERRDCAGIRRDCALLIAKRRIMSAGGVRSFAPLGWNTAALVVLAASLALAQRASGAQGRLGRSGFCSFTI